MRLIILLGLFAVALGCKSVIRALFYPPEVEMVGGLGPDVAGNSFDHSAFSVLLARHVDANGLVSYGGFSADQKELDAYLQAVATTRAENLGRYEALAFYINAYNALTIRLILDHPKVKSIRDIPENRRWKGRTWPVAGERLTLDEIEHKIIRPIFKENRIHFALVCASIGCPPLRNEAYTGARLIAQLEEQTRKFFADSQNLKWDAATTTLWVSSILDWYAGDFGDELQLKTFISGYTPNSVSASLPGNITVRFLSYNWNLNKR
ncbi:MAG: DUF547 domain-containing protein [Spirochaetota bacterium]